MNFDINNIVKYTTFEWIKSDKVGEQEIFINIVDENNMSFLKFLSGNRINVSLVNEYLTFIGVLPEEDVKKLQETEKQKELENLNKEKVLEEQKRIIQEQNILSEQEKIKKQEDLFYFDIIEKAKKDTVLNLKINLEFNFLSTYNLTVLKEIYGEKLTDCLSEYIYNKVTKDDILKAISNSLNNI